MQERKELYMPPSRACGICRNRLSEVCVEVCTPAGDYKDFDPDMGRQLDTFPKLTYAEYMELCGSMKGKWLYVMQTKIMDALNGEDREPRPFVYRAGGSKVPRSIKSSGVLYDSEKTDPVREALREAYRSKRNGSEEVG